MERKGKEEKGGPVNTSPYTQYKDLEDYKQQGYGTQGHLPPQPGRGASASVDAPTATGDAIPPAAQLFSTINVVNRHAVP
nr:uncharacterized protein LOC113698533 [Coffea arabica]